MADYSKFVTSGLTGAQNAINNNAYQPYPNYTGNQKTNPYAQQQNATGLMSSGYNPSAGTYGGAGQLKSSGYNPSAGTYGGAGQLKSSGYNPTQGVVAGTGRTANQMYGDYQSTVDQSWNKAQGAIKNMYGANGLYGSLGGGLMSGALQDGAQNYAVSSAQGRMAADQSILADQIARANSYRDAYELAGNQNLAEYNARMADQIARTNSYRDAYELAGNQNLAEYNARIADQIARASSYRDAYELAGNQNLDAWKAGQTALEYNNQLLGDKLNWGNDQYETSYANQLAQRKDYDAYRQTQIENYLGLAGGGSPNAAAQMQANAQKSAAKDAASASNTAAWLGAGGSLLGGLMSGIGSAKGWSNFWS